MGDLNKAACVATILIGVVELVLASIITNHTKFECESLLANGCEKHDMHLSAGALGILASSCQIIFGLVLLLVWIDDKLKYFILHMIFGVFLLIAFVLDIVSDFFDAYDLTTVYFTITIIDCIFCFVSGAIIFLKG